MLTTETDILVTNSEEPFAHVLRNILNSHFVLPIRSKLLFLREKYTIGIKAPTAWLMHVATAAPSTPKLSPATKTASKIIFVKPAITVTINPRAGFSAVVKND